MLGRIIEIEGVGRRISLERGFLAISGPDGPIGKAPLDDVEALILSNPAVSMTSQALAALAARGAPVVVCGPDFRPAAYLLPVDGHHAQGDRVEAQAEASVPLRKRLWADIVRAKIAAQAAAVAREGGNAAPIGVLVGQVRAGDPGNVEALAAQRYFPLMFGPGFHRTREGDGANALLNYGYTVLRAATARAIVAAGLHPSLALMHRSRGDALRLADDLMEPFRPAVDIVVKGLLAEGFANVSPDAKRRLAHVLHHDFETPDGVTPLSNLLARLAVSLAQVFSGERKKLFLPMDPLPLPEAAVDTESEAGED
jgi:CRISPR-associated protein Cas1